MKLAQKLGIFYYRTIINNLSIIAPQKAAQKALKLFSTPQKRTLITGNNTLKDANAAAVVCNNYNLACYRWNIEGSHKVLLIHGFESAAGNFLHFIQPLVAKGYQVIAFDAQAHGNSEGTAITLPEFEANIAAVNKQYGPFDSYIAHSFGGLALMHFCEQLSISPQPNVVLIAPATESVSAINRFFKILQLNNRIRKHFDQLVEQKAGVPADQLSIKRAAFNVPFSILWFHDREDPITPFSDVQQVQNDHHANIKFVITEGLGHRKIYRDAYVVQQIVEFV